MALHEAPLATPLQAPLAQSESAEFNDLDQFEDALEPSMDLMKSLEDCEIAIEKFFSNDMKGAINVMTPWKEKSLYHSHGATIFDFIPAMLTMDPQQVQDALVAVKDTFIFCNRMRKTFTFAETIGTILRKPNYGLYSEVEAHAELIHAEALLVHACLVALEGEDLTGFIKATLKIKSSHDSYKGCLKIFDKKSWENEKARVHFESGVRMGVATFNVMVSLLPPKIIALLEFVGFSGDKEYGLAQLLIGARTPGLRSVLCSMTLLVHHLVIGQFAAIEPDFDLAKELIDENLQKYPDSAWFLMFLGRWQLLQGQPEAAILTYEKAASTPGLWPQLVHLSYWEIMWAHAMLGNWSESAKYAQKLLEESMWSRTVYAYANLASALQSDTPPDRATIEGLIADVNNYRQRILGRSLPMEKFAIKRCERFLARGRLPLPGIELLCIWNMYPSIAKNQTLADKLLKQIEDMYAEIEKSIKEQASMDKNAKAQQKKNGDENMPLPYDADDLALVRYLRGALLSAMNFPRLALNFVDDLLKNKEEIKENTYLVPYSTVEVAMCHHKLGDHHLAIKLLSEARKKSGYVLESRLQFRIHSKIETIRNYLKESPANPASTAGSQTKLEIPGTLGTQGNLVATVKPVPVPVTENVNEKAKDKKDKKSKKKESASGPVAGTSKEPVVKKDTIVTTEGVVIAQPGGSGTLPLTMKPPHKSSD